MPIMKRLATIVLMSKEAKLKSVYTKYSTAAYKGTSTMAELYGTKMNDIMNRL